MCSGSLERKSSDSNFHPPSAGHHIRASHQILMQNILHLEQTLRLVSCLVITATSHRSMELIQKSIGGRNEVSGSMRIK